jgi:predicted O-linked N-acetylglucosamine transferase (SPINDLY family)
VAAERIEFNGDVLSVPDHLALYHRVDVALDTSPYNGTTTTCEALWMGVPVVTLAGRTHVSRVGASLLGHLGIPEAIAGTDDAYVAAAVSFASDLPRLAQLRSGLRNRMKASALCDEAGFARRLEDAFGRMWADRCKGQ